MPQTPPATCHTVVLIDSPQYREQILAALGIWSHALGITFTEGSDYTLRIVEVSPIPVPGYEGHTAMFNGDVIYLSTAKYSRRTATHLVLHELGHWLRMEHNNRHGSVMNLATWPKRARLTKADIEQAQALTSYCR